MEEAEALGPQWQARVSGLIEAGHTGEACEEIGGALRLALSEPATMRPPRWEITALWLLLLEQNEIARSEWVCAREGELYGTASANAPDGDRGALALELLAVADRLPTAILAALARSIREGAREPAETSIMEHAIHHPQSGRLLRDLLAQDAPHLYARYELALRGVGGSVGAAPKLKHLGAVSVAHRFSRRERIAIAAGCGALILVPLFVLSTGRRMGDSSSHVPRSSTANEQPRWLRELCRPPYDRALCPAASRVYAATDCAEAHAALKDLVLAAQRLAAGGALDFEARRVVLGVNESVRVDCMPMPGTSPESRHSP